MSTALDKEEFVVVMIFGPWGDNDDDGDSCSSRFGQRKMFMLSMLSLLLLLLFG